MPGTLDAPMLAQTSPKTHRRLGITLGAVLLAGVTFVILAALPYLALDQNQFQGYWPRRWWLLTHVVTGMVALMLAKHPGLTPFQIKAVLQAASENAERPS